MKVIEDDHYLLFTGSNLYWKARRGINAKGHIKKFVWKYAVSGLKKNNPYLNKLIESGRTDIKPNIEYTDPKYQRLSSAGPIPSGSYTLALSSTMKYEKSGGGWGVGGWSIYPKNQLIRRAGFLELRLGIDLPWIRSGFFLHEDGGRDGTAGCIGLSRQGIKNLKSYLIKHFNDTKTEIMLIVVDYNEADK